MVYIYIYIYIYMYICICIYTYMVWYAILMCYSDYVFLYSYPAFNPVVSRPFLVGHDFALQLLPASAPIHIPSYIYIYSIYSIIWYVQYIIYIYIYIYMFDIWTIPARKEQRDRIDRTH